MIDNFELIKEFLPVKAGCFLHCQIVQRAKDHKPNKVRESALRTYYIKNDEDLEKYKEDIILVWEHYGARAYINVTSKSYKQLQKNLLAELARLNALEHIFNPQKTLNSVVGDLKGEYPWWVVDIDNLEQEKEIYDWINEYHKKNYPTGLLIPYTEGYYIKRIPTVQGCHLLTDPFNLKEFQEKFPNVDVHKNSMGTLLYYPKSLSNDKERETSSHD